MGKPSDRWKGVESEILWWFPGFKRRGADYRRKDGGKNDAIGNGLSIEIKHGKKIQYQQMINALKQARKAKEQERDISIAILHKKYSEIKDSLVVMRLWEFSQRFILLFLQCKYLYKIWYEEGINNDRFSRALNGMFEILDGYYTVEEFCN